MVLIDWWSPEPHAEFNKVFFNLFPSPTKLFVFNKKLSDLSSRCVVKKNYKSRLFRALSVIKICWKHRDEKIFFVSYDVLFIPILQLFVSKIFCYEHNTTPEKKHNKHAIWQRITFFRIIRCCQSKSQNEMLLKLKQKTFWLGLPISEYKNLHRIDKDPAFIIASEQSKLSDFKFLLPKLYGKIIVKKSLSIPESDKHTRYEIVDRIEIPEHFKRTESIIISLQSSTRSTGWYNEAISYGIPLIILYPTQQKVFESTFPDYPYIKGDAINCKEDLRKKIKKIKSFDNKNYIDSYMRNIEVRFSSLLDLNKI
jgi:hypothetical protein|tara:strand:+ start:7286 stop:8218 length:933 start_codon:yes stop_codon:yes gene_type:complete